MNAWLSQRGPDRATTLSTTLLGELAKVATHFANYVRGIQDRVEQAECRYNKERVCLLEAQVLSGVYGQFMRLVWPDTWGLWTGQHLHCWELPGADIDEEMSKLISHVTATPAVQAFLVSKPEPCSTLPDFLSSIISKKQRDTLTAALAKIDTEIVWPRATLAAFLIQDQPSLTALDKVIEASKVELVVTVVFNCHKFIVPHVSNSTHHGQTLQANCACSCGHMHPGGLQVCTGSWWSCLGVAVDVILCVVRTNPW